MERQGAPLIRDLRDALMRIQMDYLEMPDLKLTARQARRLWNLDQTTCDAALGALVDANFLWQNRDGSYLRRGVWPALSYAS